jgi:hypothetical protein
MAVSRSDVQEITCRSCGEGSNHEVWLLIDACDRPDLLDECLNEARIRAFVCPYCGEVTFNFIPLLVYYRRDNVVFVSNSKWSTQANRDMLVALSVWLVEDIESGAFWLWRMWRVRRYAKRAVVLDEIDLMLGRLPRK